MIIEKILKTVWNEFVCGGHLTSLGAASVVFSSAVLLNVRVTWDILLVVYLGTQSVYLYNRYKEFSKDSLTNPERTKHIKRYLKYIPLIVFLLSFSAVVIVVYFNKISALVFGLLMLCLGLLYTLFFKKLTKKITGSKNFFVPLMWALLVIFLAIYYSLSFNLALFLIFVFIFLRVFITTSVFDIKDVESDKKEGLLTLAIVLGQKRLINILSIITILAIIPIIFGVYLGLFPLFSLALLFTIPYTFYYFKKLQDKKTNTIFFYNVIVDGEFILWSFFILLGKLFL